VLTLLVRIFSRNPCTCVQASAALASQEPLGSELVINYVSSTHSYYPVADTPKLHMFGLLLGTLGYIAALGFDPRGNLRTPLEYAQSAREASVARSRAVFNTPRINFFRYPYNPRWHDTTFKVIRGRKYSPIEFYNRRSLMFRPLSYRPFRPISSRFSQKRVKR